MKHFIIFLALTLGLCATTSAQDVIVKRNGERIKATILKVSSKHIKYVRPATELPVYKLSVNEIERIEYLNGDIDTFSRTSTPQPTASASAASVSAPVTPTETTTVSGPSAPQYCIGDIYEKDGVKGLVINTTNNGEHGTIVSLDEACLRWHAGARKGMKTSGATDRNDGRTNMLSIASHIESEGLSWSDFPAAEWCRNHGDGWYLPAVNEVWLLGTVFCGGSRSSIKKRISKALNATLRAHGGKPLNNIMYYTSSTEAADRRSNLYSHLNGSLPYMADCGKEEELFVRAFYRF